MRRNFVMAAALLLSLTPALAQQQAPVSQPKSNRRAAPGAPALRAGQANP